MGTTPAVLDILDDVDARMEIITQANGYWYDVKKVNRARLKPFQGHDLPAISYWATQTINTKPEYNTDERELRLFIESHNITRDYPLTDIAEKMATDIVTAINRLPAATAGKSIGQDGAQTDMSAVSDTKFKISVDGDAAEEVTCVWTGATTGALIAAQMQTKIRALGTNKAAVTVVFSINRYRITSGTTGAASAIVITAGDTLDCSDDLRIGITNDGQEYIGKAAAPKVSDDPSYDLENTVKSLDFDGYDYGITAGQEPWCFVLVKFGIKYLTEPFNMFSYERE